MPSGTLVQSLKALNVESCATLYCATVQGTFEEEMKGFTVVLVCLVATFFLVAYNVGTVNSAVDCNRRLRGLNRSLNRMSFISNPKLLPFNSTDEFEQQYCR